MMPGYCKKAAVAALCLVAARVSGSGVSVSSSASHGRARHGVTPSFFEEEEIKPFNPAASGPQTVAALQTVAVQAPASPSSQGPRAAMIQKVEATPVAQHAQHSVQLLSDAALEAPSAWSVPKMKEAAGTASKVLALVASGARAAVKNVAPSLFEPISTAAMSVAPGNVSSAAAAPATAALDPAQGVSTRADSTAVEVQSPGAVSFLGGVKRASELPRQAFAPSMLQASGPELAKPKPSPAAAESDFLPVKLGPRPATQEAEAAQWANMRELEEQAAAEAREAEEVQRQASLEDTMTSVRSDLFR